jgi:hypothetical protein
MWHCWNLKIEIHPRTPVILEKENENIPQRGEMACEKR